MNGKLISGSNSERGRPVTFANNIETPVTPPSTNLFAIRKPCNPSAAEKAPKTINTVFSNSRNKCF